MKKLFTSVLLALSALTMHAEEYNGSLNIIVPDMFININQDANINVTKQDDGNYELKIEEFNFEGVPVGTIDVKDVKATVSEEGLTILSFKGNTVIQDDGKEGMLVGQTVQIELNGKLANGVFKANIDIIADNDGTPLPVSVKFTPDGKATQIPNSDFEEFHNESNFPEPNHWHSFGSATGTFAAAVKLNQQTYISEDVRKDSNSKKCIKLTSAVVLGIPANGTITTGQIQAGAMSAESTKNCAVLDLTNKKLDSNGDPFYTTLTAKPDAIKLWVKFKQGSLKDPNNKYASFNAVITDGTKYQDPEDKIYTNIVAKATNKSIESKNFAWQEVTVPFDYETYKENGTTPKAILVTISTNSVPGAASTDAANPDELYVDDLSLVYNAGLKSVKFKGEDVKIIKNEGSLMNVGKCTLDDFVVEADGAGAYVTKEIAHVYDEDFEEWGYELHVTITSADLQTENKYVVYLNGYDNDPTAIKAITLPNGVQSIYNINGQKVSNMVAGQVYIVKTTDGKTKKFIKK